MVAFSAVMHRIESLKNHVVSLAATAAGGAKSPAAGRLNGKVAIVTGAGNGIGRSAAILFAEQGCNVYAVDWNEEGVRETERMIASAGYSGKCEAAKVDVGDEQANRQMVDDCVSSFGALHILFANAGISGAPKPFWELSADDYANTLRVNVVGVGMGFKYAARYMMANKVDNGSLIATASVAGLRSGAGSTDYSASKAAVVSIVQTCANQLAFTGIRANAICPGLIDTGMTGPIFDRARAKGTEGKIGQLNPAKRGGLPVEIANMALFLATEEASYVNGQAIAVCGGLSSSHPVVPGKLA